MGITILHTLKQLTRPTSGATKGQVHDHLLPLLPEPHHAHHLHPSSAGTGQRCREEKQEAVCGGGVETGRRSTHCTAGEHRTQVSFSPGSSSGMGRRSRVWSCSVGYRGSGGG